MNLHAFYNNEYIGDILLIRLTDERHVTSIETKDDLCVLYHHKEIIGYNLMNASLYISNLCQGKIKITPLFVDEFNKVLNDKNLDFVMSDYDDHFKVGKVVDIKDHPDSDHMHICQVDVGEKQLQIVCGAPNVARDQLVVVAEIGAVMPNGQVIQPSALRGVSSDGMLCSARELALPNAPQVRGILVLDDEEYQVGNSFFSKEG